ncbi:hypothetical protein SKAU_G00343740 [Synaphobranchus kaupii]|uniref:Uncharacterized protein n=1 Tax=Synaphobranchus kaupii TaxID=118154 RepID=A0A9Q1EJ32_SYNKA|nr:hypothetical protein SKAU_G00343740 [Synaphobranchus kaupii]
MNRSSLNSGARAAELEPRGAVRVSGGPPNGEREGALRGAHSARSVSRGPALTRQGPPGTGASAPESCHRNVSPKPRGKRG